jgi:hypothetical protein
MKYAGEARSRISASQAAASHFARCRCDFRREGCDQAADALCEFFKRGSRITFSSSKIVTCSYVSFADLIGEALLVANVVFAQKLMRRQHAALSVPAASRKRVARIDPAIGRRAGSGRHALLVVRELTIAGIAPASTLQTIFVVLCVGLGCRQRRGDQCAECCEREDGVAHAASPFGSMDGEYQPSLARSEMGPTLCRGRLGVGACAVLGIRL